MKDINAPNCGREGDLISFLYGELSEAEAPAFARHLQQCASCSTELAGFQSVRESVVSWRNESLSYDSLQPSTAVVVERKPSALAALREFFTLSPMWLKGAVAFATIALCLLAGLAITRWQLNQRQQPVIVQGYTNEEVESRVAQRLAVERTKALEQSSTTAVIKASPTTVPVNPPSHHLTVPKRGQTEYAKRPLSRIEREQLAADLRLLSSGDSDIDLLGDSINQ
ncbi:MAG TPA: zf-HC2 domain-containing protein [Pyrinomonadaceae bacterium]|nr:zf-HC2 domain-containing protein [Pyrinomonadaceae bacterium]